MYIIETIHGHRGGRRRVVNLLTHAARPRQSARAATGRPARVERESKKNKNKLPPRPNYSVLRARSS